MVHFLAHVLHVGRRICFHGCSMTENLLVGLFIVVLAGMLNGSFAAPMKRMINWQWENCWLTFAVSGLVLIPWAIAFGTVPHLGSAFMGVSASVLAKTVVFGILWGVGATLFGLGISRVGLALGFALILGITASFGSLLPMAIIHPDQLTTKRGIALLSGTLVMVLGLILLSLAGRAREREAGAVQHERSGFTTGLIICIFSGIFSSMLNFSFVFGDELRLRALQLGASSAMAANPIWALAVSGGFLANCFYCVYLLNKNRTWGIFRQRNAGLHWLLGITMGLLWFGGTLTYGVGARVMGTLGGIIGWPIFMTIDIVVALFWGAVSGEWKGASRQALSCNWAGIAVLLLAIAIISAGGAT
jgi:L-rhamnose-H+ transport protein